MLLKVKEMVKKNILSCWYCVNNSCLTLELLPSPTCGTNNNNNNNKTLTQPPEKRIIQSNKTNFFSPVKYVQNKMSKRRNLRRYGAWWNQSLWKQILGVLKEGWRTKVKLFIFSAFTKLGSIGLSREELEPNKIRLEPPVSETIRVEREPHLPIWSVVMH